MQVYEELNPYRPPTGKPAHAEGSLAYVVLLTAVAALGGLLFGYDTAVIAGAIGFLKNHFVLGPAMEGWAVSNVLVGCMVGAMSAGTLSDRWGRKPVLLMSAALFAVSAVGAALPRHLYEFVIARFLGGLGVGMASILSPLYIAEVAPPKIRGRLVSLNQVAIILGMLVVSLANWWINQLGDTSWNESTGWRWMFASGTLPAGLFLAALFLVPESPRWLTKQGRQDEARGILTRIAGPTAAAAQLDEIRHTIAEEGGRWRDLFQPGIRLALVIAVVMAILQQVTGINAVLYYAPQVFAAADVTPGRALLQTVAMHIVNLSFTMVAIWLVDRLGRKPLLLATSAAMGVSLVLLGAAFHWGLAPVWIFALVLIYVASFAVAMGPVVWVVLSEIFPTRTRGRAMSVAILALWIACFTLSQTVPWMFATLGRATTFWTYAIMCGVSLVFVAAFIPETKDQTLEAIEQHWTRENDEGWLLLNPPSTYRTGRSRVSGPEPVRAPGPDFSAAIA